MLIEQRSDGGPAEIAVEGELDLAVAGELEDALDRAAPASTLVDLSGCAFLDSTGIAVVLRANRRRADGDGRIVLHSASTSVLRVLTITGLTEDGLVFGDREEALAALGI
jgi:anti-anti-sigma factor